MTQQVNSEQPRLGLDDSLIGRTLSGKWRIEKRLGSGGMGTVYLATDLTVDRPVALKFLQPALVAETEYRARFEQEARVMARVDHPNLVTLFGVERDGEVPFLVMKYVTGRTLAKLIRDQVKVPLSEAMPLIRQMGAALTALHTRGYVHRDLKPGNVMVSDEGHVTLLDFGLIRSVDTGLTRPGVALGSPFYMSPEQAIAGTVDARSDVYTLGVLITELLTGKRPFAETDAHATLLAHLEKKPTPPHELDPMVPPAVSNVLLKALEKKPAARHQTVAEFMAQLLEATAVSQTMVVPVPVSARAAVAKKGDSGKQKPLEEPEATRAESPGASSRRARLEDDDDEATVSARTRARRDAEKVQQSTEVAHQAVPAPVKHTSARPTVVEAPAVVARKTTESAKTLVGLDTIGAPSQQTLSAVSDVTPNPVPDSSKTLASMQPVEASTDPSAPAIPVGQTENSLEKVAVGPRPRPVPADAEPTPSWVYAAIGGGSVLVIALLLWILLG
ncbi:MAG: serine/threonine protein kinase [Myxococcaceae bacterium]|nr:serine/threonine protein kinase [Myxococcaceae bacterium]